MTRTTWVTLLSTTLVGLASMLVWPHAMVNPGPLASHHDAQQDDCLVCHTPLRGTPESKCLACHPLAWVGLRTSAGAPLAAQSWRSNLIHNVQPGTCMDCHFEHYLKGRPGRIHDFPHEVLAPALLESCGACHAGQQPVDRVHAFPPTTCTPCHNLTTWKGAAFDHSRYPLNPDHNVACAICHTALTGFRDYTCYGCHAHTPKNMAETHLEVGLTDLRACATCHRWM